MMWMCWLSVAVALVPIAAVFALLLCVAVYRLRGVQAEEGLCRKLEPNVSTTAERFHALEALRDAGIPTVVWLCPILPWINDTEDNLRGILDYCVRAGVKGVINFGMGLTLREGNREYFYRQLDRHFPGLKERYIRTYGNAYELESPNSPWLTGLFHRVCEEKGILHDNNQIFAYLNRFACRQMQMSMFADEI